MVVGFPGMAKTPACTRAYVRPKGVQAISIQSRSKGQGEYFIFKTPLCQSITSKPKVYILICSFISRGSINLNLDPVAYLKG